MLDVATGDGEFLDELLGIIESCREAIGIDTAEDRLEEARKAVQRPGVHIPDNGCLRPFV